LKQVFSLQRRLGVDSSWLDRAQALALEPHLNPRLAGALLVAGDHQVDNRLVAEALSHAFARSGGTLHQDVGDVEVAVKDGRAQGVNVQGRHFPADRVVAAAGAWSRSIPGLPEAARPPVRPVKGQMLALAMDPASPLLQRVLWTQKAYLVPRRNGRLLVGATTEEKGFDTTLTAGGLLSLLEAAWRALPGIEELPVVETWVGFRPGSRDDAPILGGTVIEGLILATGHHRNGILLAPVTADAIATLVLTGASDPAITAFSLSRFTERAKAPMGERLENQRTERWISA
jgi:glycine oxidase